MLSFSVQYKLNVVIFMYGSFVGHKSLLHFKVVLNTSV
jgi:hypothetical protein